MEQLTQEVSPRDNSRAPAFKTPSMKAHDSFDDNKAHKLIGLIPSFQLLLHNDPESFFSYRKKVLYSTSFLTGRAGKWNEPYLSDITNEDPSNLLNNWQLFETQLFTFLGDPNEFRKAEEKLDNLRMKESGHVSLYTNDFRSLIIDSPKGEDLILGYNFLYQFDPFIDWENGFITYYSSHKDSSVINSSNSNEFATSVNSVYLFGELKTPSLPSSVHIPCIIPSQSSLPSRDEVFKDINNVKEDVAISSLHLFQVDMDLPPLSFHSSLEEQWDEEEELYEIEILMKVIPPAYHHYLDVFSKVKAEKLLPHHDCDHNIELKGLLPPSGVIYFLSSHQSETLWAYISENLEKCLITPISSSTGAPVLFGKKKDGGLWLFVDYHKLNSVTRKNRYPVPPMNQLLAISNGSTIFFKIDLHGAYNILGIKKGDEHLTALRTKCISYEYLVIPFGLTNAPASFQSLVNDIFGDFLDIFVVVYLDDIMIFYSSEEEHVKNLASVLQRLRDNNLFAKASKYVIP
ncbi:hypothetical protein O181_017706 [Austropuccinia psidii MF-1]|uniref:Reverse transcriptase domain-containing protein n=1 Tax=Austropuccinia psidii MF-1 TaxID=1389203 RepID=A0A9Q3C3W5_9BASI|nr:hypothetical protein [Austropuccinia psidii MF-1]